MCARVKYISKGHLSSKQFPYTIRDPVHGDISLTEMEMRIISNWWFQRLRGVRQLATAFLVYPGALHTRFDHSLGTLEMTSSLSTNLFDDMDTILMLRIAGLVHDIGHCAFSHEGENASGLDHEKEAEKILIRSGISDIINEQYSVNKIVAFLKGKNKGMIITSSIGSDRIDYLLRDAYFTGVAYGIIDKERVRESFILHNNKFVVKQSELGVVESILIARFLMFMNVYNHKTVRICAAMLKQMLCEALESGLLTHADLFSFTDDQIINKLSTNNKLAQALASRQLWKKVYEVPYSDFSKDKLVDSAIKDLSEYLQDIIGTKIIIDVPKPSYKPPELDVFSEAQDIKIVDVSPIIPALRDAEYSRLKILFLSESYDDSISAKIKKVVSKWLKN